MIEIPHKIVRIRDNGDYRDQYCLVHDGKDIQLLLPPGPKATTNGDNIMLVGTLAELRQQIKLLKLTAAKKAYVAVALDGLDKQNTAAKVK